MKCPTCGGHAPHITLGTGDDAMTMVQCAQCSTRSWQQYGGVIDLREVLAQTSGEPPSSAAGRRVDERRRHPVGFASAVELLRAGLTPRHVVSALVKELAIDERAARSALVAAQRSELSRV